MILGFALAVQNEQMREALRMGIAAMAELDDHGDHSWAVLMRTAEAALALDLPRAAKIAEARRRVCEADYALDLAEREHDGKPSGSYRVQEATRVRSNALAELEEDES